MYLEHFGFNELPFTLTPNLHFYCNLPSYKEAMDVLLLSVRNNEGFVKITGEVGTGKTLLCRSLLNKLEAEKEYATAYIANPNLDCFNLQKAITHELGISIPETIDHFGILTLLTDKLIEFHRAKKRAVIIIDEAQVLSDQALDGLRLLSNLETESSKLVQIILFGQTELDKRLQQPQLRQLKQRITFSYKLPTLKHNEILSYLSHRLAKSGYFSGSDFLFTRKALKILTKTSKGIPRLINILAHKALLITYGYNKQKIDTKSMRIAVCDTESVSVPFWKRYYHININNRKLRFILAVSIPVIALISYFAMRNLHL